MTHGFIDEVIRKKDPDAKIESNPTGGGGGGIGNEAHCHTYHGEVTTELPLHELVPVLRTALATKLREAGAQVEHWRGGGPGYDLGERARPSCARPAGSTSTTTASRATCSWTSTTSP